MSLTASRVSDACERSAYDPSPHDRFRRVRAVIRTIGMATSQSRRSSRDGMSGVIAFTSARSLGALLVCHGLSRLAAAGGRLLQPGDAQAGPVGAGGNRRAIASLLHRPVSRPRSDRPGLAVRVIAMRGNHRLHHSASVVLGHDRFDDRGAVAPAMPMPRLQQRRRARAGPGVRVIAFIESIRRRLLQPCKRLVLLRRETRAARRSRRLALPRRRRDA